MPPTPDPSLQAKPQEGGGTGCFRDAYGSARTPSSSFLLLLRKPPLHKSIKCRRRESWLRSASPTIDRDQGYIFNKYSPAPLDAGAGSRVIAPLLPSADRTNRTASFVQSLRRASLLRMIVDSTTPHGTPHSGSHSGSFLTFVPVLISSAIMLRSGL